MKKNICILFIFIILFSRYAFPQSNYSEFIKKVKISDKILVVGIGDAIAGILTKKGIVIVDAGESPTITMEYKKIIENEFKRNDFACLINTHSHFDHTGGNRIFKDIKILAHNNCISEILNYRKDPEKIKKMYQKIIDQMDKKINSTETEAITKHDARIDKCRYSAVLNDLKNDITLTLPDITFSDTMKMNMGDMTLNLIYFGKAHTNSDIIIHIPEEKLVFIGDLFMPGGNPSFKIVEKKDAERVSDLLNSLIFKDDIETIITGHGDFVKKNDLYAFNDNLKKQFNLVKENKIKEDDELVLIENSIRASIGWAKK